MFQLPHSAAYCQCLVKLGGLLPPTIVTLNPVASSPSHRTDSFYSDDDNGGIFPDVPLMVSILLWLAYMTSTPCVYEREYLQTAFGDPFENRSTGKIIHLKTKVVPVGHSCTSYYLMNWSGSGGIAHGRVRFSVQIRHAISISQSQTVMPSTERIRRERTQKEPRSRSRRSNYLSVRIQNRACSTIGNSGP